MTIRFLVLLLLICPSFLLASTNFMLEPVEYLLQIEPNFTDSTYEAEVQIHVKLSQELKQFQLKTPKNANIVSIYFFEASRLLGDSPDFVGQPTKHEFNRETETENVKLNSPVTQRDTKAGAYIRVTYFGKIGNKSEEAIHFIDANTIEVKQKASLLFPVLDENQTSKIQLTVITDYRAGVEPSNGLVAGNHHDYKNNKFANVFNSSKNIKIADVSFKVKAPTDLVLDNN